MNPPAVRPLVRCGLAVAAASLALLLAACATPPASPPPSELLSGRIAVRVDGSGEQPARQLSAAFELEGGAARGELRLFSPLGGTLGAVRWGTGAVVLATSQGETRYDDLDALSRDVLGDVVPLRALPDWLAGRPWPGAPSEPQPAGFVQMGWSIDLSRLGEGALVAVRAAPPAVTVRVRLDRGESPT